MGPTSATLVPADERRSPLPSENNQTFPADCTVRDQGPAAAFAEETESKVSIVQVSWPAGNSVTFFSAKDLINSGS
jgi:hypothetical protein